MDTCTIPAVEPCPDVSGTLSEFIPARHRAVALRDRFGLLSPRDLAELIGVDERTLTVWRHRKCGPDVVKLGRAIFYRREDVESWIGLNVTPMDRVA